MGGRYRDGPATPAQQSDPFPDSFPNTGGADVSIYTLSPSDRGLGPSVGLTGSENQDLCAGAMHPQRAQTLATQCASVKRLSPCLRRSLRSQYLLGRTLRPAHRVWSGGRALSLTHKRSPSRLSGRPRHPTRWPCERRQGSHTWPSVRSLSHPRSREWPGDSQVLQGPSCRGQGLPSLSNDLWDRACALQLDAPPAGPLDCFSSDVGIHPRNHHLWTPREQH